jgi:hypothetical protein
MSDLTPGSLKTTKNSTPAIVPVARKLRISDICEAVFAVLATLNPISRNASIMKSMSKVIRGPGSTLVIQSNRSNGVNGILVYSIAMYMIPSSGEIRKTLLNTPPLILLILS